jgi:hypothetical protein
MKTLSIYKSIILKFILSLTIAIISILQSVPVHAQEHQTNLVNAIVTYSDTQIIEAEYNNKTYIVERDPDTCEEQWNNGETIILDLNAPDTHEALNGQYTGTVIQTYPEQNNLIVVRVNNDLYSFYADDNSYNVNDQLQLTSQDDEILNSYK